MRYSPTIFRSRHLAAAPAGPRNTGPVGEAGADGDSWYSDLYGGGPDVNPALSGSAKFGVYDEMRKGSASVKSLLLYPTLTVRSAHWQLEPADAADPVALLIRDCAAWQFGLNGQDGRLAGSFDRMLRHDLTMLDFGAAISETVWGANLETWVDADGDPHPIRPIVKIGPRMPATISKFKRRPDGTVASVEQSLPNTRPIPGENVVHMLWEEEADRWDGVSMLRPAWLPWRLQKQLSIGAGIGYDRYMLGLLAIWHPDNPGAATDADLIGENYRSNEHSYVRLPGKRDDPWGIDILNGAATIADPVPLLRYFAEQIAEAGMQQFTKLGMTDTGSRAVGEVQQDPFFLAVQTLAGYLRLEIGRQRIRRFVIRNFGDEAANRYMPNLTVSKIRARSVEVVTNAIAAGADAGMDFTDDASVAYFRELLGMPAGDLAHDRGRARTRLVEQGFDPDAVDATIAALRRRPREGEPLTGGPAGTNGG